MPKVKEEDYNVRVRKVDGKFVFDAEDTFFMCRLSNRKKECRWVTASKRDRQAFKRQLEGC